MFTRLWALSVTKFLSTFNDNAFKSVGMFVAIKLLNDEGQEAAVIAFGSMIFMLPFVMFPTVSGWVSDRFPKRTALIGAKAAEIGVMLVGIVAVTQIDRVGFVPLFVTLFLMALQSTFLSPAFLGILPEIFDEQDLPKANGIFDLISFMGIILGCGAAGLLVQTPAGEVFTGLPMGRSLLFVGLAILGTGAAWFIPHTNVPKTDESFGIQLVTRFFSDFKYVMPNRPILLCVLGNAFFTSIGALILASLVTFGKQDLALNETQIAMIQVAAALGIGLGCFVAGAFSHEKVEFGLVPIGCWGMTVFFINLWLTHTYLFAFINVFAIGLFGGFFVLPLVVYIQERTPADVRGKTMAQVNATSFWGTLTVSILMLILTGGIIGTAPADADFFTRVRANFLTLGARDLYLMAAISLIITSSIVFYLLPDFLVRLVAILMTRFVYRIRTTGKLPRKGAALLIANHVSLVDAVLIAAASSRHVTFVVSEEYAKQRFIRPIAKWLRLISLPESSNPSELKRAFKQIHDQLRQGEIVCTFPEGRMTGNSMMGAFQRGFQAMIPADVDAPIIPVHLGLLWGSIFSKRHDEIKLRRPSRLPYPVTISFGKPLPSTLSAMQARQAISELAAATECEPAPGEVVLCEQFIRIARRRPGRNIIKDSSGTTLTYLATLIRSYALAGAVRKQLTAEEEYVGVVLPPCTGAVVSGLAVMFSDRIPIYLNFTASREAQDFAIVRCGIKRIYTSRAFIEKAGLPERDEYVYLEDVATSITSGDKLKAALTAIFLPASWARKRFFPKTASSVHNTATVLFSSGSTGMPKGAVLSHHNFTANFNGVMRILGVEENDKLLGSLPFFHSFGFMATYWLPLVWGVPVVYHPNPLDAERIGELIEEEKVTMMFATPTFLQGYIRKCKREQFGTLRIVITGAEKLRQSIADKFTATFGVMPIEGYGTTELSPVVSVNMPERIVEVSKAIGKQGAVGKTIPGVAARIVDPDTREPVVDGAEGLLLIKGPNVMKGYLLDPEKTSEVLDDGWYMTGDMGKLDEDGYLYITGRLSRFSKIGGEMVPHLALEEEIQHVLDGRDASIAVTCVPDESRGERLVVLYHNLPIPPKEIIAGLRERGLPNLWIPKPNDFVEVDTIPMLGSGKLDLRAVQTLAMERARAR